MTLPHLFSLALQPAIVTLVTSDGKNAVARAKSACGLDAPNSPKQTDKPIPAIGFTLFGPLNIATLPGARGIEVHRGATIESGWGELTLLQQTPPIIFDTKRLEEADAFVAWRDWELAAALLPERDTEEGTEYYDVRDIMGCLGPVSSYSLSRHAMDIWPNYEGNYRFKFSDAVRLIKRYMLVGRKRFDRDELELMVRNKLIELAQTLS